MPPLRGTTLTDEVAAPLPTAFKRLLISFISTSLATTSGAGLPPPGLPPPLGRPALPDGALDDAAPPPVVSGDEESQERISPIDPIISA